MLLDKGADINARGGKYSTVIQAAAVWGSEEMYGRSCARVPMLRLLTKTDGRLSTKPLGLAYKK